MIGFPDGSHCETQLATSTTSVSLSRGWSCIAIRGSLIPIEAADLFAAAGIACSDDGSARAVRKQAVEQLRAQRPNRSPSTAAARRALTTSASDEILQRAEDRIFRAATANPGLHSLGARQPCCLQPVSAKGLIQPQCLSSSEFAEPHRSGIATIQTKKKSRSSRCGIEDQSTGTYLTVTARFVKTVPRLERMLKKGEQGAAAFVPLNCQAPAVMGTVAIFTPAPGVPALNRSTEPLE